MREGVDAKVFFFNQSRRREHFGAGELILDIFGKSPDS